MRDLDLEGIHLSKGAHGSRAEGMCAMELAAYLDGEEHTDAPECVSRVLAPLVWDFFDSCRTQEERDLWIPIALQLPGTADDGHEEARQWMALDWLMREASALWLQAGQVIARVHTSSEDVGRGVVCSVHPSITDALRATVRDQHGVSDPRTRYWVVPEGTEVGQVVCLVEGSR